MNKNQRPITLGEDYEITIHDLGGNGEGVGKYRDFTVFVASALPGETVRARAFLVKKNYAKAQLLDIITPSCDRVAAPCVHYPECGGCRLQHLDYAAQLRAKQQRVAELIARIGGIRVNVEPTIGMDEPYHYRNKMQLPVGGDANHILSGFYAAGSHRIVDMDRCLIQDDANNALLAAVRTIMPKIGAIPYDEQNHSGDIRHIIGRSTANGLMAVIVTRGEQLPHADQWVAELRQALPPLRSIYHNIQPERNNIILGKKSQLLWGEPQLIAYIGDIRFALSPGSFFQVNPAQTEKLYPKVLEYADLNGGEIVIDAYCGTGTISLFLAKQAKRVVGIEIFRPAVLDARANAAANGITNTDFLVGDAGQLMPELAARDLDPDVIVMDPARAGCEPRVLYAAMAMRPRRIVYVSCNPATLARDLAILTDHYRILRVQPIDMFPHTAHIETVVLLDSKKMAKA